MDFEASTWVRGSVYKYHIFHDEKDFLAEFERKNSREEEEEIQVEDDSYGNGLYLYFNVQHNLHGLKSLLGYWVEPYLVPQILCNVF